ncbi:response regulator transcription factor [Candidatus Roizmanbacteria bacterium]|nr:response regulator transcription factor [Candidatus Roizmanbacteria bacterium]
MRILLVEDEKRLSYVVKKGLTEEGYAVDQAFDGAEGFYLAKSETYDLIILDVILPQVNGIKVCLELRKKKIPTPILMLTARTRVEDRVTGLDAGADDYLGKPFAFAELKSRIQALLRRSHKQSQTILTIDDLAVDPLKHVATRAKKVITLTPKEFAILELLLRHKNEVVTRTQIIEHTWDYNFDSLSNVVDVFITTLRRKIDKEVKHKLIHTVHGVGYKISLSK